MDVLVALAPAWPISSALAVVVLDRHDLHRSISEASASIITLVLLGKLLAARRPGAHLGGGRGVLRLQPPTAWIERDGQMVEVPVAQVVAGMIFVLRPGMRCRWMARCCRANRRPTRRCSPARACRWPRRRATRSSRPP